MRIHVAVTLLIATLVAVPSLATTYTVHADGSGAFPTIQEAVAAAADGDTVSLTDGTFTGSGNRDVDFMDRNIVVRSEGGDPSLCIIDCQGSPAQPHRGFFLESWDITDAVLEGLTIQGGYVRGDWHEGQGGGIYVYGAIPTILNCVIVDCEADDGGGLYVSECDAIIRGCTIIGNVAHEDGGGAHLVEDYVLVEDCLIAGNVAVRGGGIYRFGGEDHVTIVGTTISANLAQVGGGIWQQAGSEIERVVLWDNCATVEADEMYLEYGYAQYECCDVDSFGVLLADPEYAEIVYHPDCIFEDPIFCDPASCWDAATSDGDYSLHTDSPCLPVNSPCGQLIGALGEGCGAIDVPWQNPEGISPIYLSVAPSPFRTITHIRYSSGPVGRLSVSIFDPGGRRVRTFDRESFSGTLTWDGTTSSGAAVAPGVYFIRLNADGIVETIRVVRLN